MALWSVQRVVTTALVASFCLSVPLAGIALFRVYQIRSDRASWVNLASASQWYRRASVCEGASSSKMAEADRERWREAGELALRERVLLADLELEQLLESLTREIVESSKIADDAIGPWMAARCQRAADLSDRLLSRAVALGADPASRSYRPEDMAVRDLTTYTILWLLSAVALIVWARKRSIAPSLQLTRVLRRVAAGDVNASLPRVTGPGFSELVDALGDALEQLEKREQLHRRKLREMRGLVRRTMGLVHEPVIVVGTDNKIDYANDAACRSLGKEPGGLEGKLLGRLPEGRVFMDLAHRIVDGGESTATAHADGLKDLGLDKKLVHCAVVRDSEGQPTRIVLLLEAESTEWWRKLLANP